MATLKDYKTETLALDLKPHHNAEFDRLFKLIKNPAGFRLIILQFNDPAYRDALIRKIGQLNSQSAVLSLTLEKFPTFQSFEKGLKYLAGHSPLINLVNLENWLFPEGTKSMVVGFNYHRESIAKDCPIQLFLWMTETDIKTFAIDAPDMWAWRSAVLDFSVEKAGPVHEPVRETGLMEGMPLKARIKRINEIKEFLDDKPEDLSASLHSGLLNELGLLFNSLGKYEEALKYYQDSLEICKEVGDRQGEGATLNNIGLIYQFWGKYKEALKRYQESLEIRNEIGDRQGEGTTLNNIGFVYQIWGKCEEALKYCKESLEISKEIGDRQGERTTLNNIGFVYQIWGKYEEALKHYQDSLEIKKEIGVRKGEGTTLWNMGQLLIDKDRDRAIAYLEEAVEIEKELRHPDYEKHRKFVEGLKN